MMSRHGGSAAITSQDAVGWSADEWLLITDGAPRRRYGGAALRWDALEQALARRGPGRRLRLVCQCTAPHRRATRDDTLNSLFADDFCPSELSKIASVIAGKRLLAVYSGIEMAEYLLRIPHSPDVEVVLDLHNSEAALCRELTDAVRALGHRYNPSRCTSLHVLEAWCITRADRIWTCTQEDRMSMLAEHPEARRKPIHCVPNAVSIPSLRVAHEKSRIHKFRRVLFLGRLDWLPNEIAAHFLLNEVYPALASDFPAIDFVVAGAAPNRLCVSKPQHNVHLIGDPEDVEPLWPDSILVVPLTLGGGSRLKVLEAFVRHVPVVATRKAVEGLSVTASRHYIAAHSAAQFQDALRKLLTNTSDCPTTTGAAFCLARDHNSITAVTASINESLMVS